MAICMHTSQHVYLCSGFFAEDRLEEIEAEWENGRHCRVGGSFNLLDKHRVLL